MPRPPLDLPAVLDLLYEGAEVENSLAPALAGLAGLLDAEAGHLFRLDGRGELLEAPQFHGVDAEAIGQYHHRFQQEDPRLALATANPGLAMSDVEVIDPATFEKSALYNEYLKAFGIRYSLFVALPVDAQSSAAHGVFRSRERQAFSRVEVETFQRILPHLRRALRLRGLLKASEERVLDLQTALDALAPPALVLERTGRVVCSSQAAQAVLRREDGLRVVGGHLSAELPATAVLLAEAITRAAQLADPLLQSTERPLPEVVEVLRAEHPALRLVILPLRESHRLRIAEPNGARLLVLLQEQGAITRLDPQLIARLHGLTPTEALLAAALAEGRTVAQFARERGTSEHTVRTQLKRLLEKTETQRQAELVGLLLRTALAYPGP